MRCFRSTSASVNPLQSQVHAVKRQVRFPLGAVPASTCPIWMLDLDLAPPECQGGHSLPRHKESKWLQQGGTGGFQFMEEQGRGGGGKGGGVRWCWCESRHATVES